MVGGAAADSAVPGGAVPALPLRGVRVADLTRFVAGSQATMWLAALGAEVVKVEPPSGDPYRAQGTERSGGESVLFMALNAGKRSLAVDFRTPAGREVMDRLLGRCDLFVENSRPGSLAAHGLDWESVHERFPHIVYGSISGYGDVGPDAGARRLRPDPAGRERRDERHRQPAVRAGQGRRAVPRRRRRAELRAAGCSPGTSSGCAPGRAAWCPSSLLEFGLAGLGTILASVAVSGREPGLLGTHSPLFAPYGGFRTADGWLVMAGAGSEQLWRRACERAGRGRTCPTTRGSPTARAGGAPRRADRAHRGRADRAADRALAGKLEAAGVPAAEVRGLASVLGWPQVAALGSLQPPTPEPCRGPDAGGGRYRVVGPPFRLDRTVLAYPGPPPALGRDTRAVLADLGYQPNEITKLEDAGVVVAAHDRGPRSGAALREASHELAGAVLRRTVELAEIPAPTGQEDARRERVTVVVAARTAGPTSHADEAGNLWARVRPGDQPAVILAAHLDTVFDAKVDHRVRRDGTCCAAPASATTASAWPHCPPSARCSRALAARRCGSWPPWARRASGTCAA